MATTYDVGDIVRCWSTFTDTGGTRSDPTTVYFAYENSAGVSYSTTYTGAGDIVKATLPTSHSTGVYYYDITTTGQGLYEYRFTSTGLITASAESYFSVRRQRVTT